MNKLIAILAMIVSIGLLGFGFAPSQTIGRPTTTVRPPSKTPLVSSTPRFTSTPQEAYPAPGDDGSEGAGATLTTTPTPTAALAYPEPESGGGIKAFIEFVRYFVGRFTPQ